MRNTVHILMADDDADDRMLAQSAFEENNVINPIHFVEDGVELMDYLRGNGKYSSERVLPGLILLDLNMPKKDGREALFEIKSDPVLKSIPVVILTTSKAEEDIVKSYNLGANCFITKPVTFEGLLDITRCLSKFWLEVATIPLGEE